MRLRSVLLGGGLREGFDYNGTKSLGTLLYILGNEKDI